MVLVPAFVQMLVALKAATLVLSVVRIYVTVVLLVIRLVRAT